MKREHFLTFLGVTLISFFLVQCVNRQPASTSLLVSAAASLKEVLEEIKPMYQKNHANVDLTFNFGASGALLQQIEQAAKRQIETLDRKGALIPETQTNFATNQLALIVPNSSKSVTNFASLKEPEIKRIAIGEPRSVPAGQYAEQVLQKLNLIKDVKPKLVYANNVRQVLAAVESGGADAGFVYITDAKISDKVKVAIVADERLHSAIVYPMAVLKSSKNVDAAKAFVQYLSGNDARGILRKYGFSTPK
ncbi:MAG: molybdate ABC transporter substrate-binding protein [Leptolyngbya sp. ERB_1_2]